MKIRTAAQYRERMARRDEQAARARRTRWTDEMTAWDVALGEQRRKFGITQPVGVPRFADPHIIGQGSKPNHAARAVDIATCFPPLGLSLTGPRMSRPGARPATHATPLDWHQRVGRYQRQNGCLWLTRKQWRRVDAKQGRALDTT